MKRFGYTVIAVIVGLSCLSAAPARAQVTNPYTGNTFDDSASSLRDTMIRNRHWEMLYAGNLSSSIFAEAEMRRRTIEAEGMRRIERGQATTRFSAAPFSTEAWLNKWAPKTSADRQRLYAECQAQKQIWADAVRARGTNLQDMAECLALSFVLAYEIHSGTPVAEKPYRWLVGDFRRALLKDPYFQGMPAADKQYLLDTNFLNATDPVRLWRLGKAKNDTALLTQARQEAQAQLKRWWDEPVENLRMTADKFVNRR